MESGTAVARPSRTERWPATTVVGPIEARAARTPDAPALLPAGAAPVSYGELNAAANRMARCLADRGARPGTVVGLALTRPADLVPALLAVAKSGAAYLALDPDDAPGRLSWLLADAAPVCVLGRGAGRGAAERRRAGRAGGHRPAPGADPAASAVPGVRAGRASGRGVDHPRRGGPPGA